MDAQRLSVTATGAGAGPNRGHMPGLRPASGPASPAVAEGKLFLKGRKWLFCIGTKP